MNTVIFLCFLLGLLNVCRGLTWGSWNKDRAAGGWDLEGGQYDELLVVLSDKSVIVISSAMTSELNAGYLSDINVFFTGYIHDSYNTLTSAEQVVLRDWVNVKGGVLVIGCHANQYSSCRSYLEPFGLNVEEPYYSGDVDSTCSGDHVLLDGVDKIRHTHPEVLVIGESSASTLCELPGGKLVVSLLQYGWGYVLFSDMFMYADSRIIENDNIKFVQNLITWTDQLTCDNLAGCPEVLRLPGQCDFGRIDCSTNDLCTSTVICDSDTGCVSEPIECDDHNLCTRDFCDIKSGCIFEDVDCDDYDACTLDVCDPSSGGCFHEDPEACYPTMTDTNDQIKELQILIEQIKNQIVPPPIPSSTQQPTSSPTIVSTPFVTPPPVRAIALPTAQPTASPTHQPTSQPTAIPLADIVQEFLDDAVIEMQQFMTDQINQLEAKMQAQITEQMSELQINLEVIEEKVDRLVSSLYPSPTQIPTAIPTVTPTTSPTLEPALCDAMEDTSRADFLSVTGTCFEEAQDCFGETICSEVLTSPTCLIPFGVLHGPEYCWLSTGYEVPEGLISTPVSTSGDSLDGGVSSRETSFHSWMNLTLCIQRTCDCTSDAGKWNVLVGHISISLAGSHFECCLTCQKTENCAKWHYQGQICVLLDASTTVDETGDSSAWRRGEIKNTK